MGGGSKFINGRWVFGPLPCATGTLGQQPPSEALRGEACHSWANDYEVHFSNLGALDAPDVIPSGSVRALDFDGAGGSRYLVAHLWRHRLPS